MRSHPELYWLPDRYFKVTVAAKLPGNEILEVYKDELEAFSEALPQALPSSSEWDYAITPGKRLLAFSQHLAAFSSRMRHPRITP
jgi:hypothetical protein